MKHQLWWIVGILLLAFAVRVAGIDFGREVSVTRDLYGPPLYEQASIHPDEYFYVAIPLEMLLQPRRNPKFYENPSLLIYLDYFTQGLTGADDAIRNLNWQDWNIRALAPFPLYVMGRVYSLLGGMIAVAATIALAKRLAGKRAALLAGGLIALSAPLVQHAHYATTSSLAAGFVALCLWACLMALSHWRTTLFFVVAGIAAGLATGSRYNAAAVSIAVCITGLLLLWRSRSLLTRRVLLTVLMGFTAFPLVFLLTTPGVLLDFSEFWRQFTFIYNRFSFEEGSLPIEGLFYEYRYIVLFGLGVPGAVAAIFGMVTLRRWRDCAVLLAFLLPYSFVVLTTPIAETGDQLTILALPPLIALAGAGADWLGSRLRWRQGPFIVSAGMLAIPLLLTVLFVTLFVQPDTRLYAQRWVEANIPQGARIHRAGGYNVPLDDEHYQLSQAFGETGGNASAMAMQGIDYIIVSDATLFYAMRRDNLSEANKAQVAAEWGVYDDLLLLYEQPRPTWWGHDLMVNNMSYWHHPAISIYCVNEQACRSVSGSGVQSSE